MAKTTETRVTVVERRNGDIYETREVQTSTTLGKVTKGAAVVVGVGIVAALLASLAEGSSK